MLWPECGWQPVSLTDLITAASVKKVYRKANLCIHPDKVQQKGANLQQKYIAEKVFDLLKVHFLLEFLYHLNITIKDVVNKASIMLIITFLHVHEVDLFFLAFTCGEMYWLAGRFYPE